MKKILTVLCLLMAVVTLQSQELSNWAQTTAGFVYVQNTDDVSDGTYSVAVTWTSQDTQILRSSEFNVPEGDQYSISLDILDNDAAGRTRMGIGFDGAAIVWNNFNAYSVDQATFQTLTFTGDVPPGSTTAYVEIRFYDVAANWSGTATNILDNLVVNIGESDNIAPNGSFELWQAPGPELTITSPANNTVVNVNQVEIAFEVANFEPGVDGKIAYSFNDGEVSYTTTSPITITGLIEGENIAVLKLTDMSDVALDPEVMASLTIFYEIPNTDPGIAITSPSENQQINGNSVSVEFAVANFELGEDGYIAYSVDGGSVSYHNTTNAILLSDLSIAPHMVRLELVDMSNNPLSPPVFDEVNFTCIELMPGGMEPFDNSTATASYTDGSFVGNNNITWYFNHSRNEGDYPINGNGLMLRRASDSKLESGPIPGGISSFTMNMRKAFTGATTRQLELYINGDLVATSQQFGTGSGADETIHVFEVNNINIAGSFTIMIKCVGSSENNSQVTIDDISWTQFATTDPYLVINSPLNNSTIQTTDPNVVFTVYNFNMGTEGRVKYSLDGGAAAYTTTSPISFNDLEETTHVVTLELVDMDNNPLDPQVTAQVSFTIDMSVPAYNTIYSIQYTTDPSGDSPLKDQSITTRGVVVAKNGDKFWLQDGAGAWNGIYVYYTSSPSPAIGDSVWVSGTVTEYFNLTEITNASYMLINSGNLIADATIVSTGNAGSEMYEGVLIQVTGVNSTAPDNFGQWPVNDGSGVILVDDLLYDYDPTPGNNYRVQGVLDYAFSEWKILPRDANDVEDLGVNANPLLAISSPTNGATIYSAAVAISFQVTNFTLGSDGKIAYWLNEGEKNYTTTSTGSITGLTDGEHTINAQLVDMDNVNISPAVIASVNITVNLSGPDITPIYDIQYTTDASGDSPYLNQTVTVHGVVTASFNGFPYGDGYFVQDGDGAWTGLYIYDLTRTPAIGDKVMITGKITEYFTMTEMTNITYYQVTEIGEAVPAPVIVSAAEANTEMYESVLVKVVNAKCTALRNGFGEWKVAQDNDTVVCKDNGAFTFQEVVNTYYDVTGVMLYSFGKSTLNYRIPADIVVSTSIDMNFSEAVSLYPNPASDVLFLSADENIDAVSIISTDGKIVMQFAPQQKFSMFDISSLKPGLYVLRFEAGDRSGIRKISVQ